MISVTTHALSQKLKMSNSKGPEIYRRLKCCGNCPFLDNGKAINLRDGRVDEIKENLIKDETFSCHKTVYNLGENMETLEEEISLKMCYGAYQYLKSINKPNQIMQVALRMGIKE